MRLPVLFLLATSLNGQTAPTSETQLRSNVQLVVAPTVVTDRQGRFIHDLTEENLTLYDNNVPVKIHLDDVALPVSLVMAIQTTASARDVLLKLRGEKSLVEPLLTGRSGDAAVIAFADGVHLMQPFTTDADVVSDAIQSLEITGEGGSGIDAVVNAIRLLKAHEGDRRRVILLLSEKHDRTSKAKMDFALASAQRANAIIYAATFSPFLTPFTNREQAQPTSDMNLAPILGELKHSVQKDMGNAFAKSTGGREFSFATRNGLDEAIAKIGDDLHGQYLISFQPHNLRPGEFHKIRVEVKGHPDYVTRTRVGYWAP